MDSLKADVLILGSGFGGSLSALVLSRIGLSVLVVDRQRHPRFAIGESSTPIANMVLRSLSLRYDLPRLFPLSLYGLWQDEYPEVLAGRKRGFSYFPHAVGTPFHVDGNHSTELLVAASNSDAHSDTQWYRPDVDAFLANEVREAGIPLLEEAEVMDLASGPPWKAVVQKADGARFPLEARFVVDATGSSSVITRLLGIPTDAAPLRTRSRAVFSHFVGVPHWHDLLVEMGAAVHEHPFHCDDAALHHILDGAWMWLLRFKDDRLSAGIVLDAQRYPGSASLSPESEWRDWINRYPALQRQFRAARPCPVPGGLIGTGLLQRRARVAAGRDWALLPYSAGFVDPLHSTGIAHTLSGIERLARIFAKDWERPSFETALAGYGETILKEIDFIDLLVSACYRAMVDFRLFRAATMLYFAATISYERIRSEGRMEPGSAFLSADDDALRDVVRHCADTIGVLVRGGRVPDRQETERFEDEVEGLIRPWNAVGLFSPRVPNMYEHTAAPVGI